MSRVEIRGHDVAKELAILEEIEARLDALPIEGNSGALFRIVDNWLVRDQKKLGFWFNPSSRRRRITSADIPHLPDRGFFPVRSNYLFAGRVRARTSASAICFMTNLRAFYLSQQPVCLWIASRKISSEVLRRSLALRDQYNPSSGSLTPKIIAQDIEAEPPYILEELITGRPFGQLGDWDLLVDKVMPSLFRLYKQKFTRYHFAVEIYDVSLIYQGVAKAVSRFKEEKKWLHSPAQLLKAAEQCLLLGNEKLPLSAGHGDLCRNNLIVTADDNIVLVDWEHTREIPIAEELIKLMLQLSRSQPQLISRVFLEMRQLTEAPNIMSPKRQFLLASLDKTARLMNSGKYRRAGKFLRLVWDLINLPE